MNKSMTNRQLGNFIANCTLKSIKLTNIETAVGLDFLLAFGKNKTLEKASLHFYKFEKLISNTAMKQKFLAQTSIRWLSVKFSTYGRNQNHCDSN